MDLLKREIILPELRKNKLVSQLTFINTYLKNFRLESCLIFLVADRNEILKKLGSGFRRGESSVRSLNTNFDSYNYNKIAIFTFFFILLSYNLYLFFTHIKRRGLESKNKKEVKFSSFLDKYNFTIDEKNLFYEILKSTGDIPDQTYFFNHPNEFDSRLSLYLEKTPQMSDQDVQITEILLSSIRLKCGFVISPEAHTIHSTRQLEKNQIITLRISNKMIIASVIEITDLSIDLRVDDNIFSQCENVTKSMPLYVKFWRHNDAEYSGKAKMIDFMTMPATKIKITHPSSLKRTQKRRFLRKKISTPVKIYPMDKKILHFLTGQTNTTDTQNQQFISAIIRDISGGGIGVECRMTFSKRTQVFLEFSLDDTPKLPLISARILDCIKIDSNKYRLSVEFSGLMESTRESIIKFCINQ